MGGFQGLVDDTGQVIADGIQVHSVFQARRERGHGLVGVIPGPVEPPVHPGLYPPPQRIEQRRRSQRGGGHRHRGVDTGTWVASSTRPAYTPSSSPVTIA